MSDRIAPLATSTSCSVRSVLSPECGLTTFAIAICLPSGDHTIGDDGDPGGFVTGRLQVPDVSRRAIPPSLLITHRWEGCGGAVTRKSSFSTSKESLKRSSPAFTAASSAATNAISFSSELHANCCTPVGDLVICVDSPPPIGSTNTCGLPSTLARKPSREPLAEKRGDESPRRSVSTRCASVATSTSTSCGSCRFSA